MLEGLLCLLLLLLLLLFLLLLLLVLFLILLFIFLLCASRLSTPQSKIDRPLGRKAELCFLLSLSVVQRVYGGGDDWKATLRSTLHLKDTLDEDLRQMWLRNQDIAKRANVSLLPEDFARMVVDQDFSSLID